MENIENKALRMIKEAEKLYNRLVLIVGKCNTGKTNLIQKLANSYDMRPINLNLCLSKKMIEFSIKQRQLRLQDVFWDTIKEAETIVFLDNIEILFDVELKQDPMRLLKGFSRNLSIVVSWNGTFEKGKLTFAEPGHSEYRSYDLTDTLVVSMSGDETAYSKQSSEEKLI